MTTTASRRETRYWFEYTGAATLELHRRRRRAGCTPHARRCSPRSSKASTPARRTFRHDLLLNATNGTGYACDFVAPGPTKTKACNSAAQTGGGHVVNLGLEIGKVYEIVVFQAERHTSASNYTLTLSNFTGTRSSVLAQVRRHDRHGGRGVRSRHRQRTRGRLRHLQRQLLAGARLRRRHARTAPSSATMASTSTSYGGSCDRSSAAPGCVWAPYCGDQKVDGSHGEACDDGVNNGKGYGYLRAATASSGRAAATRSSRTRRDVRRWAPTTATRPSKCAAELPSSRMRQRHSSTSASSATTARR